MSFSILGSSISEQLSLPSKSHHFLLMHPPSLQHFRILKANVLIWDSLQSFLLPWFSSNNLVPLIFQDFISSLDSKGNCRNPSYLSLVSRLWISKAHSQSTSDHSPSLKWKRKCTGKKCTNIQTGKKSMILISEGPIAPLCSSLLQDLHLFLHHNSFSPCCQTLSPWACGRIVHHGQSTCRGGLFALWSLGAG